MRRVHPYLPMSPPHRWHTGFQTLAQKAWVLSRCDHLREAASSSVRLSLSRFPLEITVESWISWHSPPHSLPCLLPTEKCTFRWQIDTLELRHLISNPRRMEFSAPTQ